MLLLYILWDDWPTFMISASNEQLQQQLEYTLLKPDCHSWGISKTQSGREDTLQERYATNFCFKLGKNATETYGMLQTAFGASCMNRAWVFEWHERFKEGRESVRDDERCGKSKEVNTPELIGQRLGLGLGLLEEANTFEIGSVAFPAEQCTSPQLHPCHRQFDRDGYQDSSSASHSLDIAPCDFWLFPKLTGCRFETIEEMKEAVTTAIDTLTLEDSHGASKKLLERYNKWIAVGGDYIEGD